MHMIWLLVSVTSVSEYLLFKFGLFKKNWKDQKWEIFIFLCPGKSLYFVIWND